MEPTKIVLTRSGEVKAVCTDWNDAFAKMLRVQPFSTDYAKKWGGWREVPIYGETDVIFTRDVMRSEITALRDGEEDYVEVAAGTVGIISEDMDEKGWRVIIIHVGGDSGLIYPIDSYKLTPSA